MKEFLFILGTGTLGSGFYLMVGPGAALLACGMILLVAAFEVES